jgi:hypothetical protein
MKLYDRVDEETESKERKEPLCILLTVLMFMIIFLGLIMLNFNRSIAHELELTAADLEAKLIIYERKLDRLDKQTKDNSEIYIPALMKKRYLVECINFAGTSESISKESREKGVSPINVKKMIHEGFQKFKDNLISIDEVHMISYVDLTLNMYKGLRRFTDKYVNYSMKLKKDGNAKYYAEWNSNNVKNFNMRLCAMVSGN